MDKLFFLRHSFIRSFVHLFIFSFILSDLNVSGPTTPLILNWGISGCSPILITLHIPLYICIYSLPPPHLFIPCHVCPGLPLSVFSWLLLPLSVPFLSLWCPEISAFPISLVRKNILRATCTPSLQEMTFFTGIFTKDRELCDAHSSVTQIDYNIHIILLSRYSCAMSAMNNDATYTVPITWSRPICEIIYNY